MLGNLSHRHSLSAFCHHCMHIYVPKKRALPCQNYHCMQWNFFLLYFCVFSLCAALVVFIIIIASCSRSYAEKPKKVVFSNGVGWLRRPIWSPIHPLVSASTAGAAAHQHKFQLFHLAAEAAAANGWGELHHCKCRQVCVFVALCSSGWGLYVCKLFDESFEVCLKLISIFALCRISCRKSGRKRQMDYERIGNYNWLAGRIFRWRENFLKIRVILKWSKNDYRVLLEPLTTLGGGDIPLKC